MVRQLRILAAGMPGAASGRKFLAGHHHVEGSRPVPAGPAIFESCFFLSFFFCAAGRRDVTSVDQVALPGRALASAPLTITVTVPSLPMPPQQGASCDLPLRATLSHCESRPTGREPLYPLASTWRERFDLSPSFRNASSSADAAPHRPMRRSGLCTCIPVPRCRMLSTALPRLLETASTHTPPLPCLLELGSDRS